MADSRGASELAALLALVGEGDAAAFHAFYNRTATKLYSLTVSHLGDGSETEDVLQEAYLTVWRVAVDCDITRASPITWIATIARNRAYYRLRSRRLRHIAPLNEVDEICDDAPGADILLEATKDAARLRVAIGALRPCYAQAIHNFYFDGITNQAISHRDCVPTNTLKCRVRRGLMHLRA